MSNLRHSELVEIAAKSFAGPWSATVDADVHYDLSQHGDEFVVALPGSHPTDAIDWLRGLEFWPVWISGLGLVHAGFGLGAQAAWAAMASSVPTDKLITFTGYSLGGAMAACIAAMHSKDRPNGKFRLVTFGAPRVAFLNPWFGVRLARGVERTLYARAGDPVPDLPSEFYLAGGPRTRIGVPLGNIFSDHRIANYAIDIRALGV